MLIAIIAIIAFLGFGRAVWIFLDRRRGRRRHEALVRSLVERDDIVAAGIADVRQQLEESRLQRISLEHEKIGLQ